MKILLKQALKAPLSWKLLLVAALATLPSFLIFYYGIDISGKIPPLPNQPIGTVMVIYIICTLLISGYSILFAHNRMNNIEPTFPKFSGGLIKTALKNIVFGIGAYVPVLFAAAVIFIFMDISVYIAVPITLISILLCVYYTIVATARFMDTLLMRTPFQLGENCRIMKQYWKSFLLLALYNIAILIVLAVPAFLFNVLVLQVIFLIFPSLGTLIVTTFFQVLIRTYIVFICLHVFAQGYAWMKANKDQARTITVKPVKVTVAPVTAPKAKTAAKTVKKTTTKPTPVKVAAKKTVAKKTVVVKKDAPKKVLPKKTVKKK